MYQGKSCTVSEGLLISREKYSENKKNILNIIYGFPGTV